MPAAAANTAQYETVSSGRTGHAESVEITYDPRVVSTGQLLRVFFSVAHDPTQRGGQGPDTGTQYRSAIFTTSASQMELAQILYRAARPFRRVQPADRDARSSR